MTRVATACLLLTLLVLHPGGGRAAGEEAAAGDLEAGNLGVGNLGVGNLGVGDLQVGDLARRHCDLALARAAYERALDRDPLNPRAHAGLGEISLLEGRPDEALIRIELGLAGPRGARTAALWRVRALALLQQGEIARAREAAVRAASLDPLEARTQETLARAEFRSGDMDAAQEAYRRAARLHPDAEEANLRLGSGFGPLLASEPWREGPLVPLFRRARDAWHRGDFDTAADAFRLLCRLAPDVFKFRVGLGLTLGALRRQGEVRFGVGAEARYRRLPAPEPAGLRAVVPGYDTLDEAMRHALRVAVAPAARWLPHLKAQGATHEVLSLETSIADADHRASLAKRRTFDGRHYAHLRGIGGARAATGAEKLREAAAFGFHTFAHEFAHQLHHHAFPEALVDELDVLYESAKATDACLDWYAASNVEEYFAQGYEAFVSHAKRGCLKETQWHTRNELARRDPGLHAFLLRNLDLDHETPEAMDVFWAGLR